VFADKSERSGSSYLPETLSGLAIAPQRNLKQVISH